MTGALAALLLDALSGKQARAAGLDGAEWRAHDLLSLAERTAGALVAARIHPAEPVHVTIASRPADLGALLGVWLAGGVAVPVHASAPPLAAEALQRRTQARSRVDIDGLTEIADAPPPPRALLRDAALIVFTSGSTGKPKGVVVGHAGLAGKLAVLDRLLKLRPDDVVVVPLQLTFIFGIWVSLLALAAGARLVLVPRFAPEAIGRALAAGGTILAVVPSMLRIMRSSPALAAPALRTILTGGEALGAPLARATRQAFPHAALFDLYGLTETGSCDFCLAPADQPAGFGAIGWPTEQVSFRLVTERGEVAAPGAPGELQIRTPFGMPGYLDDPALTAASFSDGFFRTGDLARVRPDGRVELVGRIKEMIARGGNKIAPAEIENLFCAHPDIVAALCAGVPDERLGETVHVLLVPRPGASPDADRLRAWAAARIERYKLPDGIHLVAALPLGPTGKADRKALARLILERSEPA